MFRHDGCLLADAFSCYPLVACCVLHCTQVQAAALDLLQYLANKHTTSREPGQLLLDSPATPALLTYVGKALATQPQLFAQLASAAQVTCCVLVATLTGARGSFAGEGALQRLGMQRQGCSPAGVFWSHVCCAI